MSGLLEGRVARDPAFRANRGTREMDRSDDIDFLNQFRSRVERYLTSTAVEQSAKSGKLLKQQIGEMKPRAERLFTEFGLENREIGQHPPPIMAGRAPVISYPLLDLITSSTLRSYYYDPAYVSDDKVLDFVLKTIDECIGHLRMTQAEKGAATINRSGKVRPTGTGEGRVFIAMPMTTEDAQLEDIHEAIKNAAQDAGLTAERIDEQISNERITDRILKAIVDADYMVADLTHSRPNVYWEAGFAHGQEKTPIYIARDGTELEFDVRDYPVIFYKNATRLRRDLAERLQGLKAQREQN